MEKNTSIVVILILLFIAVTFLSMRRETFDEHNPHRRKGMHYVVYKNLDSPFNDMVTNKQLGNASPLAESVEKKKEWCNKHHKCHGFNTAGWMKDKIVYPLVPAPGSEMSIKAMYAQMPVPALSNFTFHQGMDSDGNDIHQRPDLANNPLQLASHCQELPNCQGFNTNGWIKNKILPQANWYKWSTNPNQGMWVRG